MKYRLHNSWLSRIGLLVTTSLVGFGILITTQTTNAGPVTPGTVTKIGVYQGLITIVPGSGLSVMEIGNAGRDIASTGTIYLRPGALVPNGPTPTNVPSIALDTGEANFDLGTGQLCLGTLANCRSSWPAGGVNDPNWSAMPAAAPNHLEPTLLTNGVRLGTIAAPIPAASGRAVEIYANYNGPAVQLNQDLATGITTALDQGKVSVNGRMNVRYNPDFYNALYIRGWDGNFLDETLGVVPWNEKNDDDTGCEIFSNGSCFNADTFDGDTVLPFSKANHGSLGTYHDLFWKTVSDATDTLSYLCLHSPDNFLCVGGTNPGTTCSVPGPGGPCLNGGICTQMCSSVQQICPRDHLPERGETPKCFNGLTYRDVANCSQCNWPSSEVCVYGRVQTYASENNSCTPSICDNFAIFDHKCQGSTDPLCTFGGSQVRSDRGECLDWPFTGGPGPCAVNGRPVGSGPYTCSCDLIMETDKPYYDVVAGQGADLCTEYFG